jgi:DNA-binding LacI/PurR family transcriptional regulator/DNA-binding GntR family transcriptional regulator
MLMAVGYLRDALGSGAWRAGDTLPSLAALAAGAGVSRNTMWKAVGVLGRDKTLTIMPRGRIFAGAPRRAPAPVTPPKFWQLKRNAITNDLLSGRFQFEPSFPSQKELCIRYAISYGTLRKILGTLVDAGLLDRRGRSFGLPEVKKRRARSTLVVFSLVTASFERVVSEAPGTAVIRERMKKFVDAIEKICAQSGFLVRFVSVSSREAEPNLRIISASRNDPTIAGYLINLWVLDQQQKRHVDYIRTLAIHRRPIAVFDNTAALAMDPPALMNRNVAIFTMGSRSAGRLVGRMCLSSGHRKLAFLSLSHELRWSIDRYNGVLDVYGNAGLTDAVDRYAMQVPLAGSKALFDRVLAHGEYTAWVCANDALALRAMDFLAGRGVNVPGALSVFGFDNALLSFEKKLTTVDFNIEVAAYRMFQFLLNPDSHASAARGAPVEIDPALIVRDSAGKPAR